MDLSEINQKIKSIKKENGKFDLLEKEANADPFAQFVNWFSEVFQSGSYDPTVMILSTIDENELADNRIVLLKELEKDQFIFYTGYDSNKALQLEKNPYAACIFYWPNYSRQVRIRGKVEKLPRNKSESYFATRPREAQLGAHAWIQSSILTNREEMNEKLKIVSEKFSGKEIPCPENWGGYSIVPFEYEFFQARSWRMHDRLHYSLHDGKWKITRLAP